MNVLSSIPYPEFDYQTLLHALGDLAAPRDKISRMLRKGEIIRVKKGIYTSGGLSQGHGSREILANLLYGPSCLSLEFALAFHGLIPEKVPVLTSVTTGRSRSFATPLGTFEYAHIAPAAYIGGARQYTTPDGRNFLMAAPEKALLDLLQTRKPKIASEKQMRAFLLEDMRMDSALLLRLSCDEIRAFDHAHASPRNQLLLKVLERLWLLADTAVSQDA